MKVAISVGGKFHAFYLAEQLQKRGMLGQLITSYPRFEVVKSGVRPEFVSSIISKEILERGFRKLPASLRQMYNPQFAISDLYDRLAARRLRECDLFVGWSGFSLHSMRQAKRMGAVTIVERGSAHIEYQRDILSEEYGMYGMKPQLSHPRIVEKELAEYALADYISVPSLFAKRTFLEKGFPEEKILHVPYGVDLGQFRPVPREDDVFRVIHCGGITLQKGCHYLLQAFFELNLPNTELWFVGSVGSEMKPFVEKYAHKSIKFCGHQPQSKLYRFYGNASVFALMSIQDGFGMVIPQAMSCQLPVICSANTAGEDIVKNGEDGFVLPIRDVATLKEKLLFLYEHRDICRQMGLSAQERVRSGFSWGDYGEAISSCYAAICAKTVDS